MKRSHYKSYFAAGVTAFCVIAAAILLFFLLFASGAALTALTGDQALVRKILLWLTGISYGLFVIRKGQILRSACNPFVTILYLCGLELLPSAILVIPGMLL